MKSKLLALDSNIFIYHFEANPSYVSYTSQIFNNLINASSRGMTSIISLIETLSYPSPQILLDQIEESFKTLPNFVIYDINQAIGIEAAKIRRIYRIRLPDAIQLATAIYGKADFFITNDSKLQNFKDMKVILLENVIKM